MDLVWAFFITGSILVAFITSPLIFNLPDMNSFCALALPETRFAKSLSESSRVTGKLRRVSDGVHSRRLHLHSRRQTIQVFGFCRGLGGGPQAGGAEAEAETMIPSAWGDREMEA